MHRPKSITVIGIVAIIFGLFTLVPKIYVISSEERCQTYIAFAGNINEDAIVQIPIRYHMAHGIIGSFIWLMAGTFMLKGNNWSRMLALFWGGTVLILTFLSTGASTSLYLKTSTYLVLLYFLLNSTSNRFFQKDNV